MQALIKRTGGMEHARSVAKGLAGAALYEFDQIFGDGAASRSRDARFIRSMLTWVLLRAT
jgi:geranylgeranyl diphosphate synthase type II